MTDLSTSFPAGVQRSAQKAAVAAFWEAEACGERLATGPDPRAALQRQARLRYAAEPYIHPFAHFAEGAGKNVLEVGVGMGADHLEWARARPRRLCGVDLTRKAVEYTRARLEMEGMASDLRVGDVEALPWGDGEFDLVWCWGVLHHTPDPAAGVREIYRVLRPGGVARVMLYHRNGICFRLLWLYHGPLRGRRVGIDEVIHDAVESAGTRAFSPEEVRELFRPFRHVTVRTQLGMGDLVQGPLGQRHGGPLLHVLKRVWPRSLIRRFGGRFGSCLLIDAVK